MSLEIYQAIVDTASAVGSLVAVCLAYKAFDVSRNISDHEQDNERTRLTIDALNKLQDEVLSKIYCPELYEIKSDLQEKEYKIGSLRNVGVVKSICKQVQTAAYQCSNHGISATGGFISHGYSFFRNRVSFVN